MTPDDPHAPLYDRRLKPDRGMLDALEKNLRLEIATQWLRTNDRFTATEKAVGAALLSAEKAVLKAEDLATARAESQNEWRATTTDLVGQRMSRVEYDAAHKSLSEKIDAISSRLDRAEGTDTGTTRVIPWVIAAVGVLIAASSIIIQLAR